MVCALPDGHDTVLGQERYAARHLSKRRSGGTGDGTRMHTRTDERVAVPRACRVAGTPSALLIESRNARPQTF